MNWQSTPRVTDNWPVEYAPEYGHPIAGVQSAESHCSRTSDPNGPQLWSISVHLHRGDRDPAMCEALILRLRAYCEAEIQRVFGPQEAVGALEVDGRTVCARHGEALMLGSEWCETCLDGGAK